MLVNKYKYDEDNVYVLFGEGEDYDNVADVYKHPEDGDVTDYEATKANVEMVFNGLANGTNGFPQLTEDDFLFVWTFDHGRKGFINNITPDVDYPDPRTGSIINNTITPTSISIRLMSEDYENGIDDEEWYGPLHLSNKNPAYQYPDPVYDIDTSRNIMTWDMQRYLNAIPTHKKVVVMLQCFSGAFVDPLKNDDIIILTAANEFQLSQVVDNKYLLGTNSAPNERDLQGSITHLHSEFSYHLINALGGVTPDNSVYYETDTDDFYLDGADTNDDGLITCEEAFFWADSFESDSATPQWSDQGTNGTMTSLEYPTVLSSNITSSMTIRGEIAVTNSISISSGVTLTVAAGSKIDVKSGKSITVNGIINAVGTSSKPIAFKGMEGSSWGGIKIYSSDNSVLKYCEIEDANSGVYVSNSDIDLEQCYLHDNIYGLYVDDYSSPKCYYNTFSENTLDGVKCYDNSTPYFGEPHNPPASAKPGYNEMIDNDRFGIYTSNSDVFLGMDIATQKAGGYNSLLGNNTYQVYAISGSDVDADWNYWSTSSPSNYESSSSNIYLYFTLSTNPGGGSSLAKGIVGSNSSEPFDPNQIDQNNPAELLQLARYYKYIKNYEDAEKSITEIVQKYPETEYASRAMVHLYEIARRTKKIDIESYSKEKIAESTSEFIQKVSYEILVSKYLRDGRYEEAEKSCKDILSLFPNTSSERNALFNLFLLSKNDKNRFGESSSYLAILKEKYPNQDETLQAMELLGEEVDWSLAKKIGGKENEETLSNIIPAEFALANAYPNPFNPTTTIEYSLPTDGKVTLTVYTMLGEEVATLVNENKSAGIYTAKFGGSAFSSGIYIYRLQVHTLSSEGSFVDSKKMILLK